jgi:hypothetical protein
MASTSINDSTPIPDPPRAEYISSDSAKKALQEHGKENGYALVLKRSKPDRVLPSQKRVFYFNCDRQGTKESRGAGIRHTKLAGLGYTFSVAIRRSQEPPDERWAIKVNGAHNHSHSRGPNAHRVHRKESLKQTTGALGAIAGMRQNGLQPSRAIGAIRNQFPSLTVTRGDIQREPSIPTGFPPWAITN